MAQRRCPSNNSAEATLQSIAVDEYAVFDEFMYAFGQNRHLAQEVWRMGNAEVLEALYPLFLTHGKPEFIRSDNGPEFIAANFQTWLTRVGIKPIRIYPGSPWENG